MRARGTAPWAQGGTGWACGLPPKLRNGAARVPSLARSGQARRRPAVAAWSINATVSSAPPAASSEYQVPQFLSPSRCSSTPSRSTSIDNLTMGSELQQPHYYSSPTSHFAQALTTPAMVSTHQLSPPPSGDETPAATIKMEDLSMSFTPSSDTTSPSQASQPTPPGPEPKPPTKKRKSWGQVLPEPKTNLPPRKRAKTEDEKEQRRIERVKRNRLAAHNSRERKRQEVELLQAEKDKVEADLRAAQQAMAKMAAELKAYREKFPDALPDQTFDTNTSMDAYESLMSQSNTICPRQASFPSPISMDSMDSPRDESCQPETPFSDSACPELDTTRYPAEILCDLQCPSSSEPRFQRLSLQAMLAFLILFNLTLPSMRSLSTLFSTSTNSRKTSRNPRAWANRQTSSLRPSSSTPPTPTAFRTSLIARALTCRQPLAQRFSLATRLSQQRSSSKRFTRHAGVRRCAGHDGAKARRCLSSPKLRQLARRKGFFSSRQEFIRSLDFYVRKNHDTELTACPVGS